jgi:hypothetical protein
MNKTLRLSLREKADLVAFLRTLSTEVAPSPPSHRSGRSGIRR